jgi:hypothetical protein
MNITILADYEDCYNLEEYMMWIIIKDVMRRHKNRPLEIQKNHIS